jgi:hypothetical protein
MRPQQLVGGRWSTFRVEQLECRQLMSVEFASLDGTGNNIMHLDWGSAGIQLLRQSAADYSDGISTPAGADRPSARAISNAIAAALPDGTINDRNLSAFVYAWGQFIDHDMDLTVNGSPTEAFNILVPQGDESFDPLGTDTQIIGLNRSQYDLTTGTSTENPRQQINSITAWIDGSMIYGSDTARAAALRTFNCGQLKTSDDNLLPFNTDLLANANDAHLVSDAELFLAGDVRANENIELTSLHTLFMREHNRIAASLAARNPALTDEQLYQRARQQVVAEIQAITYNEFLPALLGRGAVDRYSGYDSSVNPGIANEFSTAAFRLGHSMLGDDVEFLDNNGEDVRDELPLAQAFFNPDVVEETGIDPILKYLASDRAQEIDNQVVDGVRNFLFGPPGAGGFDLASLNIQRGRDHGLADYNTVRESYGLARVDEFSDITSDAQLQQTLQDLYGSVDNIDLWVGGLAEDHVAGGSVGPLFEAIISDQFERLRDGDRFWYQNEFSGPQLDSLNHTRLSDIIRRNTTITSLQSNVFVFDVSIQGRVFNDANRSGRPDRGEMGLAGRTVQLFDNDGNLLQSTTTDATGRYSFPGLDLDTYRVRVLAENGWTQTTADPADILATRGGNILNINFGFAGPTQYSTYNPFHWSRWH